MANAVVEIRVADLPQFRAILDAMVDVMRWAEPHALGHPELTEAIERLHGLLEPYQDDETDDTSSEFGG